MTCLSDGSLMISRTRSHNKLPLVSPGESGEIIIDIVTGIAVKKWAFLKTSALWSRLITLLNSVIVSEKMSISKN